MKSIETEILINAPATLVWKHLVDFAHYPDWNSFIPNFTGELKFGSRWKVTLHPPGGNKMTFSPLCTKLEIGKSLWWKGQLGIPGLFDGEHMFSLIPIEENKTLLKQNENFSGILIPFMWKYLFKSTFNGFNLMNQQLKERVEATT